MPCGSLSEQGYIKVHEHFGPTLGAASCTGVATTDRPPHIECQSREDPQSPPTLQCPRFCSCPLGGPRERGERRKEEGRETKEDEGAQDGSLCQVLNNRPHVHQRRCTIKWWHDAGGSESSHMTAWQRRGRGAREKGRGRWGPN